MNILNLLTNLTTLMSLLSLTTLRSIKNILYHNQDVIQKELPQEKDQIIENWQDMQPWEMEIKKKSPWDSVIAIQPWKQAISPQKTLFRRHIELLDMVANGKTGNLPLISKCKNSINTTSEILLIHQNISRYCLASGFSIRN
jgi:hypothetical protein